MKTSKNGIDLIASFEGLRLEAYKDVAGILTIGYGHTEAVKAGDKITKADALKLLADDIKEFEQGVSELVHVSLNQNQFDALVSLAFNIGLGNFRVSTLLRRLNQKSFINASKQFSVWNKARVNKKLTIVQGLVNRRKAEQKLFDTAV